MKEAEVTISFDTTKMTPEQVEELFNAQKCLLKAGITFDSGSGCGGRDWEFDWSLEGPAKVYFHKLVEGGDQIAVESPY